MTSSFVRSGIVRRLVLAGSAVAVVAGLSGCGLFGGGSPPAKTYVMVPQQGTTQTPPSQ